MNNTSPEIPAEFLKALADPTRVRIMDLLRTGEKCVCEIFPAIGGRQSNTSRHLAILRRAGLVRSRKQGVSVYYAVRDRRVFRLLDLAGNIARFRYGTLRL